ncbi:MAG: ribosome hibernation-promoting factor, HPF/YfiA family [Immundisolibacter sp.]|uniref:ribosome hibernation-promoting factor, HPF/YfiA family n=1 Tax=Immundisolibacter sp. TaxID=1934948 RepID=UPI0035635BFC
MRLPLQITARGIELTEAIESAVRKKAEKLDHFSDQIMACRVVIECPHKHHHKGVLYNVHIDLTVPGAELVVKREPNEDLYVALRDAFDAAGRQLRERMDRNHDHHGRNGAPLEL